MYLTNRIKNEFENHAKVFENVEKKMTQLDEAKVKEVQAFEGGCREYESLNELERDYQETRKSVMQPGMDELQVMQSRFDSILEESFAIDPKHVEALTGGVLKLNNLSDGDLMSVAKKYRDNYSGLMTIADYSTDHESKYAKHVSIALKKYIEVATDATKRLVGSCRSGIERKSKYPGSWRGFCDGYINEVQRADDCLQSTIDGDYQEFTHESAIVSALQALSR